MGIETALFVAAAVAEAGAAVSQTAAASARNRSIDIQGKELTLQAQQKTLNNYDVMERVIDKQVAYMTTTGTAFSSPSYNAIQRDTLNTGARLQRNTDIETELQRENLKAEKENVNRTLYAQLFGDAAQTAEAAFSAVSKAPTSETG